MGHSASNYFVNFTGNGLYEGHVLVQTKKFDRVQLPIIFANSRKLYFKL